MRSRKGLSWKLLGALFKMASFFKFSCSIYWIAWLYYMGYMIGLQFYVRTYIIKTPAVQNAEKFIMLICLFNVTVSFVGCAFVKCNIVHIYFTLCFVLPLAIVNITATAMGMVAIREATFPDVDTFVSKYSKDRKWISMVEQTADCCGYWGYWDHASILKRPGVSKDEDLSAYIPPECCKSLKAGQCPAHIDIPKDDRPVDSKGQTIEELAADSNCPFPDKDRETITKHYKRHLADKKFYINKSLESTINKCGCHKMLLNAHMNVYENSHFIFFIVNACFVLLMLVVYIRNWCVVRLEDGNSDHSLDEDSLSQLSLEALQSDAGSSDGERGLLDIRKPSFEVTPDIEGIPPEE